MTAGAGTANILFHIPWIVWAGKFTAACIGHTGSRFWECAWRSEATRLRRRSERAGVESDAPFLERGRYLGIKQEGIHLRRLCPRQQWQVERLVAAFMPGLLSLHLDRQISASVTVFQIQVSDLRLMGIQTEDLEAGNCFVYPKLGDP